MHSEYVASLSQTIQDKMPRDFFSWPSVGLNVSLLLITI